MKTNNTTLKSRNTSVMAGIDKHITTSITINGTAFTQADLKAVFQSQITAITTNGGRPTPEQSLLALPTPARGG
jgi:hypothetical protein